MDPAAKQSLLNNLIGTPEVTVKLDTKSLIMAGGVLVTALTLIFLIQHAIKKI